MSKRVLGIDIETSGINPKKDFITEIGYCLHDFEINQDLLKGNVLLKAPGGEKLTEVITKITGLDDNILEDYGVSEIEAFEIFSYYLDKADYVAAHNAKFEKDFLIPKIPALKDVSWIDTKVDIDYPSEVQTRKLTYLAAEYGIYVRRAHRALDDVDTMIELMKKFNFNEIVDFSKSRLLQIQADVSFAQKDLAKEAGFYWEPKTKSWMMEIKELSLDKLRELVDFNILIVG